MRKLYSVLFSFIFITSSFAQVPTNGLVSEWLFNNGSITNGANSLLAVVPGSVLTAPDRQGIANNALNVNPGGYINFAGDEFDNGTTGANAAFTFSFWIKLDAFNSTAKCIFAKATFETACTFAGRQFAVLINSQQRLQLQAFGSLTGGNHVRIDGNSVITVGEWHHIAVSVDMATVLSSLPATTGLTMYVDGALQTNFVSELTGAGISPSGMLNGPAHFGFGTYLNTAGNPCVASQDIDAHFDDFRIYDRTVTPQEVTALQNDGCDEAVVTLQPQSVAICTGTASLSCEAQSSTVNEMRWERYNGTSWVDMGIFSPGPSVSVGGIDNTLDGPWRVKLTSPCGLVTYSDEAVVAIGGSAFTINPGGNSQLAYICAEVGSLELQSNAIGENITYQWQERINSVYTDIPNATDPTYTTTSTGEFNVNVTACGVTETYVPYNVLAAQNSTVTIVGFVPGSGVICVGQSASISTQVSTTSTFEWQPSGGTSASAQVSPTETTLFTVTATTFQGCVTTASATITVIDPQPVIGENGGVLEVTGGNFVNIQWYLNGNLISGANQLTYTPTADGNYTVNVTINNCNNTSDPYTYTGIPTGINGVETNGLKVYPNPFNTEFVIESTELTTISVMNAMGEVVLSRTINGRTSVDATQLATGIYFVREETSGAVMKLVKN